MIGAFVLGFNLKDWLVPDVSEELYHSHSVAASVEEGDKLVGEDGKVSVLH